MIEQGLAPKEARIVSACEVGLSFPFSPKLNAILKGKFRCKWVPECREWFVNVSHPKASRDLVAWLKKEGFWVSPELESFLRALGKGLAPKVPEKEVSKDDLPWEED